MDKLLIFPGKTEKGIFTHVIDTEHAFLNKTAAEYHPKIAEYIRNAKPVEGKTQILLTALGAGEYWGNNVNGDYFPEASLAYEGPEYGHKTFELNAKIYKHHVNKDPTASFGDVALSVYNPVYRRVELIVVLDNEKAPDIAKRVNEGDYPDWSMGCRVPYDVCSICGNKAPTTKQYCEHLKYYMGRIHPQTGRAAYAINYQPKFFDISQVLIGADRIAKTLRKVASASRHFPASAVIAEKMAETKTSTIDKTVPVSGPPGSQESVQALVRAIPEVKAMEPEIPRETLNNLARNHDIPSIMSTLSMMGIIPKPQEFQRIVLVRIGKESMADDLDNKNMCFDPCSCQSPTAEHEKILGLSPERFNPDIMNMVSRFVPDRSYAAPHLLKRIILIEKNAVDKSDLRMPIFFDPHANDEDSRANLGIFPILALAAGLYAKMAEKAPSLANNGLAKTVAKYPGLAVALGTAAPIMFNAVFGEGRKGQFVEDMEPEIDIMKKAEAIREKPFSKTASNTSAALSRMFLGVPAVYMASGVLQKHKNYNPQREEGKISRFIRRNPDIIGGALALDGLMALSGKGTHGLSKNIASAINKMKPAFVKSASMSDLATEFGWALASGPRGLTGKITGSLMDQAILEGSKKLLSKKKTEDKI